MGYVFSLVLSREITEDEMAALKVGCGGAADFGTDVLPTDAELTVTKMDIDDADSPTLAEAIESALAAVAEVTDLSVSELFVPAQPAGGEGGEGGAVEAEEPVAVGAGTD
ncbi:hypothetical protein RVR_8774 [Actinacidiphila reveromycinica]|uniref:Uncharacterized protein n=1 Tax=Actinacidiphila reveromycinica TaxID=659352 RepID=A0A7U3UYV9_9ACTN|nr:hypothetical protein [Streptomyces sp. SN-593]BBB01388.1 hypothetical protein RVR_8774 [Streptomyces sp. SN-593]